MTTTRVRVARTRVTRTKAGRTVTVPLASKPKDAPRMPRRSDLLSCVAADVAFPKYLRRLHDGETSLMHALTALGDQHRKEPDIREGCKTLARWSQQKRASIEPWLSESVPVSSPRHALFQGPRKSEYGLLLDLHDLALLIRDAELGWKLVKECAADVRDHELESVARTALLFTHRQASFTETTLKHGAPQILATSPPGPSPRAAPKHKRDSRRG